jgi:translation initiation factor 2B subunit (eIF-2B alpha/beta/delta family)
VDAVERVFVEAARDRSRGAAAIERRLLERLASRGDAEIGALRRGAAALRDGQPLMANLVSLAARAAAGDAAAFHLWAVDRLELLRELDERLARAAWPLVRGAPVVVTVSRSSAVAAVVRGAVSRGWRGRVVVLDGAPSGRGPDQARRLVRAGVAAVSQPDAVAPMWLESDAVVVVGADAVGPESFVNAVGTRLLLEAAERRDRARVLAADRGKDVASADLERFRHAVPESSAQGAARRWPVFEEVPLALVDTRVDENGRSAVTARADGGVERPPVC